MAASGLHVLACRAGDRVEADAALARQIEHTERARQPLLVFVLANALAFRAIGEGRLDEGERLAEDMLEVGFGVGPARHARVDVGARRPALGGGSPRRRGGRAVHRGGDRAARPRERSSSTRSRSSARSTERASSGRISPRRAARAPDRSAVELRHVVARRGVVVPRRSDLCRRRSSEQLDADVRRAHLLRRGLPRRDRLLPGSARDARKATIDDAEACFAAAERLESGMDHAPRVCRTLMAWADTIERRSSGRSGRTGGVLSSCSTGRSRWPPSATFRAHSPERSRNVRPSPGRSEPLATGGGCAPRPHRLLRHVIGFGETTTVPAVVTTVTTTTAAPPARPRAPTRRLGRDDDARRRRTALPAARPH